MRVYFFVKRLRGWKQIFFYFPITYYGLYVLHTNASFLYLKGFERYVETGRVAYVSNGQHLGKLVSIVDIIDQNRVLVDGPASNIPRGQMRLSDLHLTKFRLRFPHTGSTRIVRKAWEAAKVDEKWSETMWAKKVEAKKKRAALSDFDRFKLRKARQIRNKLRTDAFYRLKSVSKKSKAAAGSKAKGTAKPAAKPAKAVKTAKPAKK
ncbi:60S ribosomal protein L14 [Venturia canescens]|uniref:60S ribosomal protein L14 n=1 Tax=Venturia canescens TaxID=32260 RepID=UPI001C9C6686|nr:60S ribosomal protein L14 [Venturia canescens]